MKSQYASGAIIKAPAFTNALGFETYSKMIRDFEPNMVIVIDNDMLYNFISTSFKQTQIIQMAKISGA